MRLIEQRFLRGPNLWSSSACLMAVIELGPLQRTLSHELPGFGERLTAVLPGLAMRTAALEHGCLLAEVLAMVIQELQRPHGEALRSGRVTILLGRDGRARLMIPCPSEEIAKQTCAHALALVASVLASLAASQAPVKCKRVLPPAPRPSAGATCAL